MTPGSTVFLLHQQFPQQVDEGLRTKAQVEEYMHGSASFTSYWLPNLVVFLINAQLPWLASSSLYMHFRLVS
jgi:hypothetical protein